MAVTTSLTMITTFPFNDTRELIDFLNYHSTIGTWEITKARLTTVNGMSMDMDTKKILNSGQLTYLTFNNIKSIIYNFLETNSYTDVNLELKFKYPDNQRHIMDPSDAYEAFWLNCYSNPSNALTYMAISYLERERELPVDPVTSWAVYIHSLYNDFQDNIIQIRRK